jgi:hypothetical protein
VAFLFALNSLEVGTFFTTANLGEFIIVGFFCTCWASSRPSRSYSGS